MDMIAAGFTAGYIYPMLLCLSSLLLHRSGEHDGRVQSLGYYHNTIINTIIDTIIQKCSKYNNTFVASSSRGRSSGLLGAAIDPIPEGLHLAALRDTM